MMNCTSSGIDQKTGYPVMDGNGSLLSTSGDKDRMESSAVDSDGLNASAVRTVVRIIESMKGEFNVYFLSVMTRR